MTGGLTILKITTLHRVAGMIALAGQASTCCWFPGLGLMPAEARCQVVNQPIPLCSHAVINCCPPSRYAISVYWYTSWRCVVNFLAFNGKKDVTSGKIAWP